MSDLLFSPEQHAEAARLLADFCTHYQDSIAGRPIYPEVDRTTLRELMNAPLPDEGISLGELFEEFERVVVARYGL